ncbi:tRNA dihydrouridine synthase DusB [Candidatus Protochlamydia phocaeensis]|uniref:tRNA dihydrouridine synthase DusB n=1 Tax=Candidatus Protochlamydia phocaeensis TaxID=1414722 RepID=UPI0008396378|nr:tRNA dihydrouridine synthase DusB [Candidatus Protochlamydia phocaeensis]
MSSQAPLQFGQLKLPNRIFYAPLAGCSDYPFRKMSAKYGPGLMYCEMVKMDALVRHDPATYHLLDYAPDMHPIGGQLCGSKPSLAGQAAKIIEDLGFDVVDLNCGCPVDKVTKDGSGSGMLKTPHLIGDVLANMVAAVKIPVTVKIRAGWDEKQVQVAEIVKIAEQAGAKAICIHGRTRQQGYRGPANWDYIKQGKQAATTIKVIGNGDILDGPSAAKMFAETGCDAVLVARGTMGQPWIVQDILHYLEGLPALPRTLEDCRQALFEHFLWTQRYHNDHRVSVDMRRVGCWYLKKSSGTRQFRELISKASELSVIKDLILNFPLGEGIEEDVDEREVDCCA